MTTLVILDPGHILLLAPDSLLSDGIQEPVPPTHRHEAERVRRC